MAKGPNSTPLHRLVTPIAPPWVGEVLGPLAHEGDETEKDGVVVQTRHSRDVDGGELLFVRIELPGVARLPDDAFRSGVVRCYVSLAEVLQSRELQAFRIWNYVPSMRRPSESGFSRYEVFNEGRTQGYVEWYGQSDDSGRVASSGVDHRGEDLVVHALASSRVAVPIENPRQRPAYRYSSRYGPVPPCFSRAARLDGGLPSMRWGALGLVAGTASIVGEDSRHVGDLDAQVRETCLNLAAVSSQIADGSSSRGLVQSKESIPQALGDAASRAALARYRELRVYLVRERSASRVVSEIRRWLPSLTRLDVAAVDLCRPELLVEAEGIVRCD